MHKRKRTATAIAITCFAAAALFVAGIRRDESYVMLIPKPVVVSKNDSAKNLESLRSASRYQRTNRKAAWAARIGLKNIGAQPSLFEGPEALGIHVIRHPLDAYACLIEAYERKVQARQFGEPFDEDKFLRENKCVSFEELVRAIEEAPTEEAMDALRRIMESRYYFGELYPETPRNRVRRMCLELTGKLVIPRQDLPLQTAANLAPYTDEARKLLRETMEEDPLALDMAVRYTTMPIGGADPATRKEIADAFYDGLLSHNFRGIIKEVVADTRDAITLGTFHDAALERARKMGCEEILEQR